MCIRDSLYNELEKIEELLDSLEPKERLELVIKILQLAGIIIKDPALYQMASQENQINTQQEKQ